MTNVWCVVSPEERLLSRVFFLQRGAVQVLPIFTGHLNRMVGCDFSLDREIHYTLDENLMVIKAPGPAKAFKINGEDKIIPGIGPANSEVGVMAMVKS